MSIWTMLGYAILVMAPLTFLSRLMSFNPLRWIYGLVAMPFAIAAGLIVVALSGAPEPTAEQIKWYVWGVAGLGALMIASRFCTFLLQCFSPARPTVLAVHDAGGNRVGNLHLEQNHAGPN